MKYKKGTLIILIIFVPRKLIIYIKINIEIVYCIFVTRMDIFAAVPMLTFGQKK